MEALFITAEIFKKRLADLALRGGLTDFPSKRRDRLVLLKSIAIGLAGYKSYSEKEVNQVIIDWLEGLSDFFAWDHFMLRRELVDEKFLTRNPDGSCYRINPDGPREVEFDPEIDRLDVVKVIVEAREAMAQRKAVYLQKQAEAGE